MVYDGWDGANMTKQTDRQTGRQAGSQAARQPGTHAGRRLFLCICMRKMCLMFFQKPARYDVQSIGQIARLEV